MSCRGVASSSSGISSSGGASNSSGISNGGNDPTTLDDQETRENQLKRLSLQMDDYSDNVFTQMMELGHMSQIRRTMVQDRIVCDRHKEGRVHVMGEGEGVDGMGDSSVGGVLSNPPVVGVGFGVGAGTGVGGFHEEDLGVVARSVWQYLHHHHHHHHGGRGRSTNDLS